MRHIDKLVIEVTRKCNLECYHCLRGESQKYKVFKTSFLDNLFDNIESVGMITFTGGEPLLNVDRIIDILEYARINDIDIEDFYIVSNGTVYSKKLMLYLDGYPFEFERSLFEISQDQYHDSYLSQNNINKYEDLKEYYGLNFICLNSRGEIAYDGLIDQGNAKENRLGQRKTSYQDGFHKENSNYYCDDMVYVSANGNVINACDLSYDNIDQLSFGSIAKNTLNNIIDLFTKEEPQTITV